MIAFPVAFGVLSIYCILSKNVQIFDTILAIITFLITLNIWSKQ